MHLANVVIGLSIIFLSCFYDCKGDLPVNPSHQCPEPAIHLAEEEHILSINEGPAQDVYKDDCWYFSGCETDCEYARKHNLWGIWLPEVPPLFRPFIADPRQVTYSVGWRFNDRTFTKNIIPVSFGDIFPLFRWCDIFCFRGDLEIGIEGAVWAIFDPLHTSAPLIDADYYVGIPLSYAFGNWAFRLRGYHISTHIGDEWLINHPRFYRLNPSIEAFDFYLSNQFTQDIRLYGGVGWIARQDNSYRGGPFYLECGVELRLFELGYRDYCNRLYGVPFLAMDLYYQSHFKKHINSNFAIGYEWGKVSGLRRRVRIFLHYHDGYTVEGQFSKCPTQYLSLRASYGF
jgi:hypothetical protein